MDKGNRIYGFSTKFVRKKVIKVIRIFNIRRDLFLLGNVISSLSSTFRGSSISCINVKKCPSITLNKIYGNGNEIISYF